MKSGLERCVVCQQLDCDDPEHMRSHAQTLMIADAMSIASVIRRREPTELKIGDLTIRCVVDPTMPPNEMRLITGPRPDQQVTVKNLG